MPESLSSAADQSSARIHKVSVNTSVENDAPSSPESSPAASEQSAEVSRLSSEVESLRQKLEEMACCSGPFDDELSSYLSEQFSAQKMIKRP